jgi:isochorismate synthase EntC
MKKIYYSSIYVFLLLFTTINGFSQTTITLQPDATAGKDATVWSIFPSSNFGSDPELVAEAWTWSGNPGAGRALVAFDLSSIPVGATIQSATLTLYNNPTSQNALFNGEHSHLSGSNASTLQRVTTSWNQNTVTWNNQPSVTSLHEVSLPEDTTPHENYVLNVMQLVQDMMNNPTTSFGFMVQLDTESYYRALLFATSDHPDSTLHPKLQITYTSSCTSLVLQPDAATGKDATVWSIFPNSNFGSDPELVAEAWTWSGNPGAGRALVAFDLSTIPIGATIQSATLTLYNNPTSQNALFNGEHSHLSGSNASTLQRVTNSWNQNTVTWNNQPSVTSVSAVTLSEDTTPHENYVLNVMQLVQDMVNNPSTSFGFMVQLDTESYYRALLFATSDHPDSTLHPKLEICYTLPSCTSLILQPDAAAGEDATVWSIFPNSNFASDQDLDAEAWTWTGNPGAGRGLIQFDLSSISAGATIQSATLTLYNNPTSQNAFLNGEHSYYSGSNQSTLSRVITTWNENTVTWNNQPAVTSVNSVTLPEDTTPHENYVLNVMQLVQDMVNNPSTSFGFMLQLDTESYYRCLLFATSDHPNASLHPKLEICYTSSTGISEISQQGQIKVYPNPSKGKFTVAFPNSYKDMSVEIINSLGQTVYNRKFSNINSGKEDIELKAAAGLYFVKILAGEKSITQKVIIE